MGGVGSDLEVSYLCNRINVVSVKKGSRPQANSKVSLEHTKLRICINFEKK